MVDRKTETWFETPSRSCFFPPQLGIRSRLMLNGGFSFSLPNRANWFFLAAHFQVKWSMKGWRGWNSFTKSSGTCDGLSHASFRLRPHPCGQRNSFGWITGDRCRNSKYPFYPYQVQVRLGPTSITILCLALKKNYYYFLSNLLIKRWTTSKK